MDPEQFRNVTLTDDEYDLWRQILNAGIPLRDQIMIFWP